MVSKTKIPIGDEERADRLETRDRTNDVWRPGATLRRIEALVRKRSEFDAEIADAVANARGEGHSWNTIGLMLGTSKQGPSNDS